MPPNRQTDHFQPIFSPFFAPDLPICENSRPFAVKNAPKRPQEQFFIDFQPIFHIFRLFFEKSGKIRKKSGNPRHFPNFAPNTSKQPIKWAHNGKTHCEAEKLEGIEPSWF